MGCFSSKEAPKDNFQGPGRVLGSAPPPSNSARASVPARAGITGDSAAKTTNPGRTTGGASTGNDPRSAAAAAAEVGSWKRQQSPSKRKAVKPMVTTAWM